MSSRQLLTLAAVISGVTLSGAALATPSAITMNFDSLTSGTSVGGYYNGVGGPDYGAVWNDAPVCSSGGCGVVFTGEPSAPNVLETSTSMQMQVAAGFTGSVSFAYIAQGAATIDVYDATNPTSFDQLIGESAVSSSSLGCVPGVRWSCWSTITVSFSGTGQSIAFAPIGGLFLIDDVTFTPAPTSVPEPGSLAMLGLGLVGLGFLLFIKRQAG